MRQKLGEGLQTQASPPSQIIGAKVVGQHRELEGYDRGNDVFGKIGRPDIELVAEDEVGEQPQNEGVHDGSQNIGQKELGEGLC